MRRVRLIFRAICLFFCRPFCLNFLSGKVGRLVELENRHVFVEIFVICPEEGTLSLPMGLEDE